MGRVIFFRGKRFYIDDLLELGWAEYHRRNARRYYWRRKHAKELRAAIDELIPPKKPYLPVEYIDESHVLDDDGIPTSHDREEESPETEEPSESWLHWLATSPYYAVRWALYHGKTYWIPYSLGLLYLYGRGVSLT